MTQHTTGYPAGGQRPDDVQGVPDEPAMAEVLQLPTNRAHRWEPLRTWETAVKEFLDSLDSPVTRRVYRTALFYEAPRLQPRFDLPRLSRRQLVEWRARLAEQPTSPATKRQHMSAMRSFVSWTHDQGWHQLKLADAGLDGAGITWPQQRPKGPIAIVVEPPVLTEGQREWRDRADEFLDSAFDRVKTRHAYRGALYSADHLDLATLDHRDLAGWKAEVMASSKAVGTKRQSIAAMRSFLRWAGVMDHWTGRLDRAMYVLKLPAKSIEHPRAALSEEQAARIMQAARDHGDEALIGVLLGLGLRVNEVSQLDVRDFHVELFPYLWLRDTKGGGSRSVPMLPDLAAILERHTAGRRDDMPLFMTRRGPRRRLMPPGIGARVKLLAAAAGIAYCSPHTFRHTAGMRCLTVSGNVMAVKGILGHRDIATTQGYLDHLALADLAANLAPIPSAHPTSQEAST